MIGLSQFVIIHLDIIRSKIVIFTRYVLCAFGCLVILMVFFLVVWYTPFDARCIWNTHATKTWNKSYNLIEAVLTYTQTFHNFKSFGPVLRSINQLQIFIRTETTFSEQNINDLLQGRTKQNNDEDFRTPFLCCFYCSSPWWVSRKMSNI